MRGLDETKAELCIEACFSVTCDWQGRLNEVVYEACAWGQIDSAQTVSPHHNAL